MTEVEWLACPDRDRLLDYAVPPAAARKWRLFACAVTRRLWPLLTDARSRRAVEVAERVAEEEGDGDAGWRKHYRLCFGAHVPARAAVEEALAESYLSPARAAWLVLTTVRYAVPRDVKYHATFVAGVVAAASRYGPGDVGARHAELLAQARLVRDLCGNPFRRVRVDPAWLDWRGGTVRKMARVIYDEHRFDDLPILADALEDAGCAEAALLAHCRSGGEHARGCWAVDLLLGKSVDGVGAASRAAPAVPGPARLAGPTEPEQRGVS